MVTSKCYGIGLGRANAATCGIAQHLFYIILHYTSTLTFERSCWVDILSNDVKTFTARRMAQNIKEIIIMKNWQIHHLVIITPPCKDYGRLLVLW